MGSCDDASMTPLNGPCHVIVSTAAPIPVGDDVEVFVIQTAKEALLFGKDEIVEEVTVRHVASSVFYGRPAAFDATPRHPVLGVAALYRAPRVDASWQVVRQFQGRVRECVIANCRIDIGNGDSYIAPVTSLLLEPIPAAPAYR